MNDLKKPEGSRPSEAELQQSAVIPERTLIEEVELTAEPTVIEEPAIEETDAAAIPVIEVNGAADGTGDHIEVAQDYLRQIQEGSLRGLAEWVFGITFGVWDIESEHIEAGIQKLRAGRTDGAQNEFETLVKFYSEAIETICHKLKLPLRSGVASGVIYELYAVPAQKPVLGTEASVIVIPEQMMMLCHFVCKALAWMFPISEEGERYAVSLKPKRILKRLRRNPELRTYITRAIAYFATNDRRCLRPYKNTDGPSRVVWFQLLLAAEFFMVAHEYSHHIADHAIGDVVGTGDAANTPLADELVADYMGALISAHFGATVEPHNFWATSGVAAVIMLGAIELVRRARTILENGQERPSSSNSHPPYRVRILNLDRLNRRHDPRQRKGFRDARRNLNGVIEGMWELVRPEIKALHARGLRPLPTAAKQAQWMP